MMGVPVNSFEFDEVPEIYLLPENGGGISVEKKEQRVHISWRAFSDAFKILPEKFKETQYSVKIRISSQRKGALNDLFCEADGGFTKEEAFKADESEYYSEIDFKQLESHFGQHEEYRFYVSIVGTVESHEWFSRNIHLFY